jgi:hypothetical protein
MKTVLSRKEIRGNLIEIPSGRSYADFKMYGQTEVKDMIKISRVKGKMSQRVFYEYLTEEFTKNRVDRRYYDHDPKRYIPNLVLEIIDSNEEVLDKIQSNDIENLRRLTYQKCMQYGATPWRRSGKPNKKLSFVIYEAA